MGIKKTNWEKVKKATELLTLISIAVSLPLGIWQIYQSSEESNRQFIEKTYDDLDHRYVDFLKLILEYPKLDCYDVCNSNDSLLPEEKLKQKILYTILVSIMERAYVMHRNQDVGSYGRINQWPGWNIYINSFMVRPRFCEVWKEIGAEYDYNFQVYMNRKIGVNIKIKQKIHPEKYLSFFDRLFPDTTTELYPVDPPSEPCGN